MTTTDTPRQRELPFDDPKEQARRERVERLLGTIPKLDLAPAPRFDYDEATAMAKGSSASRIGMGRNSH